MDTEVATLRELVRQHRVCWTTTPEKAVVSGELRPVGYGVELSATRDGALTPGDGAWGSVVATLQRVVDFVVPSERGQSFFDITLDPKKTRMVGAHGNDPDMVATITILNEGTAATPANDGERASLEELTARLREIGAREGSWSR